MCPSSLSFYLSLARGAAARHRTVRRARSHSSVSIMSMCYLVENNGFEPLTPCLQSRCSSQLS